MTPEKLKLLASIFASDAQEEKVEQDLMHGKFYGGLYNGKRYMYSESLIAAFPIDKLERFIKKQIGYV